MAAFGKGLFWGGLTGVLAGLLLAPRKGAITRARLSHFIEQTTDDVNDVRYKLDNLNLAVHRLTHEGMDSLKTAQADIQSALKQFKEESEPRVRRVKADLANLEENLNFKQN